MHLPPHCHIRVSLDRHLTTNLTHLWITNQSLTHPFCKSFHAASCHLTKCYISHPDPYFPQLLWSWTKIGKVNTVTSGVTKQCLSSQVRNQLASLFPGDRTLGKTCRFFLLEILWVFPMKSRGFNVLGSFLLHQFCPTNATLQDDDLEQWISRVFYYLRFGTFYLFGRSCSFWIVAPW